MRAVVILISLIAWSLSAQAVEVMVHSSEALMGRDQQEGFNFTAVVREPQVVLVQLHLPGKQFTLPSIFGILVWLWYTPVAL